ncbi:FeoA family protein [Oceanirhabdus seepicola]|uniref:Ferrous iron transport protein A n=1 Tax=Oceanirhabdus seepicola TaxID=2828781 RepID=A0A9J6P421_9CLOT|nr:ferrous iron transport protein A [Oceanirhabdus seepicola]MCM1990565.1 ferrous iron transport protein A [Oceanirhabdus seepicola]
MSICDLYPGQKAYVEIVAGEEKLCKRLNALGCVQGAEITFKNKAPLGDPIIINLKGTTLALRKKDAKLIQVKKAN